MSFPTIIRSTFGQSHLQHKALRVQFGVCGFLGSAVGVANNFPEAGRKLNSNGLTCAGDHTFRYICTVKGDITVRANEATVALLFFSIFFTSCRCANLSFPSQPFTFTVETYDFLRVHFNAKSQRSCGGTQDLWIKTETGCERV
jgi:hypothetical protein